MDVRIGAETLPNLPIGAGARGSGVARLPRAWRFDGFEFDLKRGELHRPEGGAIALRPKAEALLRHLLAAPGRLFSRDDLIAAVWPSAVVTDDSLVQCVGELRHALGDHAQRLIRTVPRRGYRLEAAVSVVFDGPATPAEPMLSAQPVSDDPVQLTSPPAGTPRRRPAWAFAASPVIIAVLGSAALIGAAAVHFYPSTAPVHIDDEIAARSTVAIMPFAASAERPGVRSLADSVADEIASQFATRIGMRGIGRAATQAFDGPTPLLERLSAQLKATHVVTGRVATLGDDARVSVDVQILSAPDGQVIWAKRFEGLESLGAGLASDVGQQVVNAVRNRKIRRDGPWTDTSVDRKGGTELTLQGWRDLDQRKSVADIWRARARFQAALEQDFNSVIATNGLAASYNAERTDPGGRLTAEQIAEFERIVERARSLAPDDVTALLLWGQMQIMRGRADLALPALEKANRLVPSYPMGYMMVARSLMMLGRTDEVRPKLERAIELGAGDARKTSGAYAIAAEAALMLGDDERAHELARRGIAALPSNADAHATLAAVDALAGRTDQASTELAAFRKLAPTATVARHDELRRSQHPVYLAQRARLYEGLRKAGLPER